MSHEKFMICITACQACAIACNRCATACLDEPEPKMMADCIRTDLDCAEICNLAVSAMTRGSDCVTAICRACAEVCDICAKICETYDHDHCRECADACRNCAQECWKMVA